MSSWPTALKTGEFLDFVGCMGSHGMPLHDCDGS
jgi:hypothetical protein